MIYNSPIKTSSVCFAVQNRKSDAGKGETVVFQGEGQFEVQHYYLSVLRVIRLSSLLSNVF